MSAAAGTPQCCNHSWLPIASRYTCTAHRDSNPDGYLMLSMNDSAHCIESLIATHQEAHDRRSALRACCHAFQNSKAHSNQTHQQSAVRDTDIAQGHPDRQQPRRGAAHEHAVRMQACARCREPDKRRLMCSRLRADETPACRRATSNISFPRQPMSVHMAAAWQQCVLTPPNSVGAGAASCTACNAAACVQRGHPRSSAVPVNSSGATARSHLYLAVTAGPCLDAHV
jgi:hypothetical protein